MAKSAKIAKVAKPVKGKATKAKIAKARKGTATEAKQVKYGVGLEFSDSTRITVKVSENPKRGESAKRFAAYLRKPAPKTVADALGRGLTRADIRYDAGKGFIALAGK